MCVALILPCKGKVDSFFTCRHAGLVQEVGRQYPVLGQWNHRPESRRRAAAAEPEEEASQSTDPGGAGQLRI